MCTTKAFHELLKVHSVRTNISISKYYLLESFFLVARGISNWSWDGTHVTQGIGIHSLYHYTPLFPTPFARHGTQVNPGGIDLVTSNLQTTSLQRNRQ